MVLRFLWRKKTKHKGTRGKQSKDVAEENNYKKRSIILDPR